MHTENFVTLGEFNSSGILHRLNHYTKVMFVRHPLERLISAYRSKFQTIAKNTEYYRRKYGIKIKSRLRKESLNSSELRRSPVNDVRFDEFVSLVVMRLIKPPDRHWRPMVDLCYPCAVRYDFVGRYENLQAHAPATALPRACLPPVRPPAPRFRACVLRDHVRDACFAPDRTRLRRKTLASSSATSAPTSSSPGSRARANLDEGASRPPSIHGGWACAACAGSPGRLPRRFARRA